MACQEERLTVCSQQISNLLKLNYEDNDVQKHRGFVENIVDAVSDKIGQLYPVFKTLPKLPNGSFFQGTKIEEPCEFDFLNPLAFSENQGIIRTELYEGAFKLPGVKDVYISRGLKEILSNPWLKHDPLHIDKYSNVDVKLDSYDDLLVPVHKAVSEALTELHKEGRLVYKGICELKRMSKELLKEGEVDPRMLKRNEVMLDSNDLGPCITMVVGGPLCVTHFDMTFCIEDHRESRTTGEVGRYFVLPSLTRNWIPTHYVPGHKELDEHHRQILMILKYCLGACKKYQNKSTYNSHVLKTLVLHHGDKCQDDTSLGRCFYDVAQHVFRMKIDSGKTNNEYLHIYTTKWLEGLMNARYPRIDALGTKSDMPRVDVLFTLVLYILVEFMQSCPEARDLLRGRDVLSVSLQLICKYSANVLDFKSDPQQISKDDINGFIGSLRDLRHKGDEINNLLSSPPFPFPPYWPDPKSPVTITETGTITKIGYTKERQRWTKWKKIIEENIRQEQIRLRKEMETRRQKEQDKKQREGESTKKLIYNFRHIGPLDEGNRKQEFLPSWEDEESDEESEEDGSEDDEEEGVDVFTFFKN